jgi:SAM-dependent methyltransferase
MKPEKHLARLYKDIGDLKYDFRNSNLINLLIRKVRGSNILDIGCGSGYLLRILSNKGKNAWGIEPNKKLIEYIGPKLNVIRGFAEDIDKLVGEKFDTIFMVDVLEHIKNDRLQIKKIYKTLNKGGLLIIVVPAHQLLYGERDKKYGHYRRYSKKALIKILSENGFRNICVRHWNMVGFFPYLFYEKILKRELNNRLRTQVAKSKFETILNKALNLWFKYIENNFDFGFGLSLISISEKS